MKRLCLFLLIIPSLTFAQDSLMLRKIFNYELTQSKAYSRLDYLCNEIGPRLTGSSGAEKAVQWTMQQLKEAKADSTFLVPCMVPHWERGIQEKAWVSQNGKKTPLTVCALGGSVATPPGGLESEVLEIYEFADLQKLGRNNVAGKIVFINHAMEPRHVNTFHAYGECGGFRYWGAKEAAAMGASGVIVRSLTLALSDLPHTGVLAYNDSFPKIPACAISTIDAELLSGMLKKDSSLKVGFSQNCKTYDDVLSHNVVAEIRGSEYPEEIILVGAHLDSWDLATGAHDNGTGVVQCMEMIDLFRNLGIKPKRTVRCVLFMSEENSGNGAKAYAARADSLHEKHIAAIESDRGGFTPRGFTFKGDTLDVEFAKQYRAQLEMYGLHEWVRGYAGTDINKLDKQGTLLIGYSPDSQRYFDVHHNAADTFDKVNKRELELGAASMSALVYLLSEYGIKPAAGH
jgi:hypothetical protein